MSSSGTCKIVVIPGQGIGPECVVATKKVLAATGVAIEYSEGRDIQLGYPDAHELFSIIGAANVEAEAAKRVEDAKKTAKEKTGKESDYYKFMLKSLTPQEKATLDAEVAKREKNALRKAAEADAVLKGALRTLDEGDEPSKNVTIRKMFEEYANIRRCVSLDPVVSGTHKGVDILFVRENVEGLYAAIEHRLSRNYTQAVRHITPEGCELIIRAAFEAALKEGRKKVSGLEKPNILKITGGLFKEVFLRVSKEYEKLGISADFKIIDDGLAAIADKPQDFDVVVTTNMFGDIGSDVAAKITGGVGLVSSNNTNPNNPKAVSMFETMGGTADDIAGLNKANPIALIDAAAEMLLHIGGKENVLAAEVIKAATLDVLAAGYYVGDIKRGDYQAKREEALGNGASLRLGTQEFAEKIAERVMELKKIREQHPEQPISELLSADNPLRGKMRSYKAAVAMESAGTAEWIEKVVRNVPPNPVRAQSQMVGVDFLVDESGMETIFNADGSVHEESSIIRRRIAEHFKSSTEVDIASIFNEGKFGSLQAIRSRGEYIAARLTHYMRSLKQPVSPNITLDSLLADWKLSPEVRACFSKALLESPVDAALVKLTVFSSQANKLVRSLYVVLEEDLGNIAKRHGFTLARISSRGTEVYPTIGDPEIRSVHCARLEVDKAGILAGKETDLKAIQSAALDVQKEVVALGWVVSAALLNRSYTDAEGVDKGTVRKGVSRPYGVNLGTHYGASQ